MAVVWGDNAGTVWPISSVSSYADSHGWDAGWRITDNASSTLWLASDGSNWLFTAFPSVFVVNTITMEIVDSEWDYTTVNVLSIVEEIDDAY